MSVHLSSAVDAQLAAVMMFFPNVSQGLVWYHQLLTRLDCQVSENPLSDSDGCRREVAQEPTSGEGDDAVRFAKLVVQNSEIWFHEADAKGPSGVAGSVAYWQVADLMRASAVAQQQGAQPYRGPISIPAVGQPRGICQLLDPWGNAFGFLGPYFAVQS